MKKTFAQVEAFLASPAGKKIEAWALRVAVAYVCAKAGIAVSDAVPK